MDVLPSNIVFNIFSRLPVKCLARSRCISKVWCSYIDDCYLTIIRDKRLAEEPTPLLYHQHLSRDRITTRNLCFHVIELIQTGSTHDYVLKVKEGPFEFMRMKPHWNSSLVSIQVQGSCNGLICLSQDDGNVITSLVVIHRLRKECYELPPFPLRFEKHMHRESCGLGFDTFSNSWKMVCVLLKEYTLPYKPDMVKKNLCTMVHVFGTNSWREIPQVPSYPISEKEEFGLIDPPKRMCDKWREYNCYYDQLVDLNGEVGYVCCRTMEVWVLNKQKEWVPHCRLEKETVPDGYIDVIGCWNKDGDILIKCKMRGRYIFFIYNLKSGVLHKTNVAGSTDEPSLDIFMYPNTLPSIHGINTNTFS
ncbi:F-box domain containing protein [Tanacetum coccineum]